MRSAASGRCGAVRCEQSMLATALLRAHSPRAALPTGLATTLTWHIPDALHWPWAERRLGHASCFCELSEEIV